MTRRRKAKRSTATEKKIADEMYTSRQIEKAQEWSETTGLCPVCKIRVKAAGITCGEKPCIEKWLRGKTILKREIIVDEITVIE